MMYWGTYVWLTTFKIKNVSVKLVTCSDFFKTQNVENCIFLLKFA